MDSTCLSRLAMDVRSYPSGELVFGGTLNLLLLGRIGGMF